MGEQFKLAPLDKTGKLTTYLFVIGIGIITLGFIYLLPFLFSPRRYLVSQQGIVIRALISSEIISIDNIKSIEIVDNLKPGTGLTWMGGLFGYAGDFALKDGSVAKVFATRWDRMVRIATIKGNFYLLSPADPEIFVETVLKQKNKILRGRNSYKV